MDIASSTNKSHIGSGVLIEREEDDSNILCSLTRSFTLKFLFPQNLLFYVPLKVFLVSLWRLETAILAARIA
jgi:hypothetical protein